MEKARQESDKVEELGELNVEEKDTLNFLLKIDGSINDAMVHTNQELQRDTLQSLREFVRNQEESILKGRKVPDDLFYGKYKPSGF
ncbi:MAG: hypothetical protein EXS48_02790 [Candidatus Staskawiczbacteria bacterium]|nr:hypothetical protein [Candidatus Staskawiczbacteria bacterium]